MPPGASADEASAAVAGGAARRDGPTDLTRVSYAVGRALADPGAYGMQVDEHGFVLVADLLGLPELQGVTLEDIRRVAAMSCGARGFRVELEETEARLAIRARWPRGSGALPRRAKPGGAFHDRTLEPWPREERISHALGRILRYHAEEYGLPTDCDGFVPLAGLLDVPDLQEASEADVRQVVASSFSARGQRFEFREGNADHGVMIRALYRYPQDDARRCPGGARGGVGRGGYSRGAGMRHRAGFSRVPPYESEAMPDEFADQPTEKKTPGERSRIESGGVDSEPAATSSRPPPADAASPAAVESCHEALPDVEPTVSCASASTAASNPDEDDEAWERYVEPATQRVWFWNAGTEEVFFADEAAEAGWERFLDSAERPWWWHAETDRFFYEKEEEEEDVQDVA
mmetsp:Transcript_107074/g.301320  ORF Transcript_107074/g.301320 Transcript_107074/m.301320 type:complete len:404 (-) Transcript_107074:193-1404(-)